MNNLIYITKEKYKKYLAFYLLFLALPVFGWIGTGCGESTEEKEEDQ